MVSAWPAASYEDWRATCDTLHAHTQVLGKLAVKLAPPEPELQHAALRLTARGWETAPLPAPDGSGALVVALDLHRHQAGIEHSAGLSDQVALTPNRPVCDVTQEVLVAVGGGRGVARAPRAASAAFADPAPAGFAGLSVSPAAAHWDPALGEYILDWDDIRSAPDPHAAALEFARSAFREACLACAWDTDLAATADGSPPPVR